MEQRTIDWNVYARAYDVLMSIAPYRDMLADVANAVITKVPALTRIAARLLDAGCGTGNLMSVLRARNIRGHTLAGIDASPHMLARAEAKHGKSGAMFIETNLNEKLPFEDGSFDGIVCTNALYATTSPRATLTEFARVLTPHGSLVIANPHAHTSIGRILKAHARSEKSDAYWDRFHTEPDHARTLLTEAFAGSSIDPDMLEIVFLANRAIIDSSAMWFPTEDELVTLIRETSFTMHSCTTTYAGQALLATAHRST